MFLYTIAILILPIIKVQSEVDNGPSECQGLPNKLCNNLQQFIASLPKNLVGDPDTFMETARHKMSEFSAKPPVPPECKFSSKGKVDTGGISNKQFQQYLKSSESIFNDIFRLWEMNSSKKKFNLMRQAQKSLDEHLALNRCLISSVHSLLNRATLDNAVDTIVAQGLLTLIRTLSLEAELRASLNKNYFSERKAYGPTSKYLNDVVHNIQVVGLVFSWLSEAIESIRSVAKVGNPNATLLLPIIGTLAKAPQLTSLVDDIYKEVFSVPVASNQEVEVKLNPLSEIPLDSVKLNGEGDKMRVIESEESSSLDRMDENVLNRVKRESENAALNDASLPTSVHSEPIPDKTAGETQSERGPSIDAEGTTKTSAHETLSQASTNSDSGPGNKGLESTDQAAVLLDVQETVKPSANGKTSLEERELSRQSEASTSGISDSTAVDGSNSESVTSESESGTVLSEPNHLESATADSESSRVEEQYPSDEQHQSADNNPMDFSPQSEASTAEISDSTVVVGSNSESTVSELESGTTLSESNGMEEQLPSDKQHESAISGGGTVDRSLVYFGPIPGTTTGEKVSERNETTHSDSAQVEEVHPSIDTEIIYFGPMNNGTDEISKADQFIYGVIVESATPSKMDLSGDDAAIATEEEASEVAVAQRLPTPDGNASVNTTVGAQSTSEAPTASQENTKSGTPDVHFDATDSTEIMQSKSQSQVSEQQSKSQSLVSGQRSEESHSKEINQQSQSQSQSQVMNHQLDSHSQESDQKSQTHSQAINEQSESSSQALDQQTESFSKVNDQQSQSQEMDQQSAGNSKQSADYSHAADDTESAPSESTDAKSPKEGSEKSTTEQRSRSKTKSSSSSSKTTDGTAATSKSKEKDTTSPKSAGITNSESSKKTAQSSTGDFGGQRDAKAMAEGEEENQHAVNANARQSESEISAASTDEEAPEPSCDTNEDGIVYFEEGAENHCQSSQALIDEITRIYNELLPLSLTPLSNLSSPSQNNSIETELLTLSLVHLNHQVESSRKNLERSSALLTQLKKTVMSSGRVMHRTSVKTFETVLATDLRIIEKAEELGVEIKGILKDGKGSLTKTQFSDCRDMILSGMVMVGRSEGAREAVMSAVREYGAYAIAVSKDDVVKAEKSKKEILELFNSINAIKR